MATSHTHQKITAVFIIRFLATAQVNNPGLREFTHKGLHESNIYLVHVPFIFGKKLQPQTILSDLKKTVISTFPRHYCSILSQW